MDYFLERRVTNVQSVCVGGGGEHRAPSGGPTAKVKEGHRRESVW